MCQPVTYNGLLPNGNLNPVSVTLRIPTDRRNAIKNDSAVFAQDKWTINRATINAGLRWDWFISETMPETLPAEHVQPGHHIRSLRRRDQQPRPRAASAASRTGRT